TKFVPVIVTVVPPAVVPDGGAIEVTVGAGPAYVKPLVNVADCVSGLVTVTLAAPAACGGVVAVIVVAVVTVTPVAAVPPIVTVAPVTKFVPVIVTPVPPAVEPDGGAMEVTVGAGPAYVKPLVNVAACVSGLVTVTFAAPAACAGVVAVIVVAFVTLTLVAAVPPMLTVAPVTKFVPVIVTVVPPAVEPDGGAMDVTVGAGPAYVKPLVNVAACVSGLVTVTLAAPAACGGVVAVIVVAFVTLTPVAAVPPIVTVAPVTKFVPVI